MNYIRDERKSKGPVEVDVSIQKDIAKRTSIAVFTQKKYLIIFLRAAFWI